MCLPAPTLLCLTAPTPWALQPSLCVCGGPPGMLNSVIELWRYPSAQACHDARQASRKVVAWRECIATVTPGVEYFTSSFMQAAPFSPMQ
jgi:hypothetical protein